MGEQIFPAWPGETPVFFDTQSTLREALKIIKTANLNFAPKL